MARRIIKADDVKDALKGKPVESVSEKRKATKAAQDRAKNVAADICRSLVFFASVEFHPSPRGAGITYSNFILINGHWEATSHSDTIDVHKLDTTLIKGKYVNLID